MLSIYPACFMKTETGGYSVLFPDLNNLATCGNTFNEAMEMAVDCLAGYLYDAELEKEEIPAASEINNINVSDIASEYETNEKDILVSMVTVDVKEYAKKHFEISVKKTLTIPAWLNDLAIENKINFSQTLQNALKEQLHVI